MYVKPSYPLFAADVLCYGAAFACAVAEAEGVSGAVMARWLNKLALKARG